MGYFFPYKKVGWETSSPSYFTKVDNLMYYTNGSLEFKKYINFLIKSQAKFNNPLSKDMTQINIPNIDNKIEYTMPLQIEDKIKLELDLIYPI